MIANRRCCRSCCTRFIACLSHHLNCLDLSYDEAYRSSDQLCRIVSEQYFLHHHPRAALQKFHAGDVCRLGPLRLQTAALGVLCFLRRSRSRLWLAHVKRKVCRQEFSDGKHATSTIATHPDLLPGRLRSSLSSAFTRWAYPMPCLPFFFYGFLTKQRLALHHTESLSCGHTIQGR